MRKIILILVLSIMVIGVSACSGAKTPAPSDGTPTPSEVTGTLEEIMEQVYDGTKLDFERFLTEVTDENVEYYLGTNDIEYDEALASEPMMMPHAHTVVLLRAAEGADIEAIKTKIKENVDARKWICVGLEDEEIVVENIGNLVILIMDREYGLFQESFSDLAK